MATITLTVTVSNPGSGNKYYIDGALQATVSMIPGNTYKFDQADNSNSGHPLRLSTTSNGSHNSGSEYTTGVTTSGTPGSSGAYTQIEVTVLTVQSLYYYCTAHSGMGGAINVGNSSTLGLKEMSGFPIQNLTADPVPFAQAKTNDPYGGTWASGGALNTARMENFGNGVGTQTAAGVSGGYTTTNVAVHEQYNGTSWTEATDLNTARSGTWADGTQSASWVAGGATPSYVTNTETWNGSSWTEVNEINTARAYGGGTCGRSSTAGLVVAGYTGTANSNAVESWDGTNWTEVSEVNTARRKAGGFGTSTAAFAMGAAPSPSAPATNLVESWNGSAWTETTEFNTGRGALGAAGTTTDGLIFGSEQAPRQITEAWNGTAWSEVNDMGVNQGNSAGAGGTGSSAFIAGGTNGSTVVANTEEWSFTGIPPTAPAVGYSDAIVGQMYYNSTSGQFKAIKDGGAPLGSWASGGNMNTAGDSFAGYGTKTATGKAGGRTTPGPSPALTTSVASHEQYNGTSWTEVGDLNQQRWLAEASGVQTSAIIYGGANPGSASPVLDTETWNGSSWTEVNNLNTSRRSFGGAGLTNTSALAYGGRMGPDSGPSYRAQTELWNGSTWTEVNDLNQARAYTTGGGTSTDAILVGGYYPPGNNGNFEQWNGTSWTEASDINTARQTMSSGITTQAMCMGGDGPSTKTEAFDGTSWSEVSDLATGRYDANTGGSTGSPTSTIIYGGYSTAYTNITEEWTAADFEIKTLTTS
ncbi:hypothetical protein OAH18_01375 [bacterium]|nr:hypothetical protein [bacterium]